MDQICQHFGISRQAHYQKRQREYQRQVEDALVLEMFRQVRRKHPRMGTRKILSKLQPNLALEGLHIGRDRLFDVLRSQDLLIQRKKIYRRTTIPGLFRAPNRLPGLTIFHPNQVWVCDITYLEVEIGRFVYLFVLMDLFARFILGWHVAASLSADGALTSLDMALTQLPHIPKGLIHHSDHGVQYTSHANMDTLLNHQIVPSMGAVGNCYDNIFAERLIGILKNEYCLDAQFPDISQVNIAVQEAIYLYNTDRPHLSLNMAVPSDVYNGVSDHVPHLVIPNTVET
jgi:transposase InsO family protein